MVVQYLYEPTWERMARAVEKVKERAARATRALEVAGVPYAVIGGNAVASWVSRVDEGSVRNTRDVDILLCRVDLEAAKTAMAVAGFVHAEVAGVDLFTEGPTGKPSDGVHVIFAGEKVRGSDPVPAPLITESVVAKEYTVVNLEALVRMKLVANRDKDRTHLRDLVGVGLIDPSWVAKYPPELAARLQHIFDTPGG
jgi:hypothetical protein